MTSTVRQSEVTHIEWCDAVAAINCRCGDDDLAVSFDGETICPTCKRIYTTEVQCSLTVWCDGVMIEGVPS